MALAGIELRYLVDTISRQASGYYVSNIYGITKDSILFKLHHTEKPDLYMMASTSGIWLTTTRIENIEPNRLQKRLRSDILRLRLKQISQAKSERIAYCAFEGFGKEFVIVIEFFGDGNIILCSDEMKILALQHSIDVRHRKLGVGLTYEPPPQNGPDIFEITPGDFDDLRNSDLAAARWLGRTLGLPKRYAEGAFKLAGLDSQVRGNTMAPDQIKLLYDTVQQLVRDVAGGNHTPVIIGADVLPVRFEPDSGRMVESFISGLDKAFTESLVNAKKEPDDKLKQLEAQLSEQDRAVQTVQQRSSAITNVANSMYEMISNGTASIREQASIDMLARNNAKLLTLKGVSYVMIGDQKIAVNYDSSLQSIASVLFDEAKHQARAIQSITDARLKTQKKLDMLQNQPVESLLISTIRKKSWYERYRWFFTSDGHLAIGGRDAASNSAVIRKHLESNDKVFHADIFGSPFFILKGADILSAVSMNEVAHATACFSRAWREGLHGTSSYWVNPSQVKKSAPSGEFLPKGSFTIEGQRNFIKPQAMRLAVGVIRQDESYVLTCGPVEPIQKSSVMYCIIEPQGIEMADAAKKIRIEFARLDQDVIKGISIDDFVRVMPAGKSQIKHVERV